MCKMISCWLLLRINISLFHFILLFQFSYDSTNPLEIDESLTYSCNTDGHNRRKDNFQRTYQLKCLENNTFETPSWPTCVPDTYCPAPTSFNLSSLVVPDWKEGDDRSYLAVIRWSCSDKRYQITRPGAGSYFSLSITCGWFETYSTNPETFECVLKFCYNPDRDPLTNGQNVGSISGLFWNNYTLLNGNIYYHCQSGLRLEQDTDLKNQAADRYQVPCGPDGNYAYPAERKQCLSTVQCMDPGLTSEVQREYTSGSNLGYTSVFQYTCKDPRQFIKLQDSTVDYAASISTKCHWRQRYTINGTLLMCKIVRCGHPHNDPGSHMPPPTENSLILQQHATWHIEFEEEVNYTCTDGEHFENDEEHPTQNQIRVKCTADLGVYNIPTTWPNCTRTVKCGQPPDVTPPSRPWNEPGTRKWVNGALEFQV